jgi:cytochrome o ubiquinol oxidase subunit 2
MIPKTVRRGLLSLLLLAALAGCNTVVMNPPATSQAAGDLIKVSVWLMLLIIVPVMILIVVFAMEVRASNTKAGTSRTGTTRPSSNW